MRHRRRYAAVCGFSNICIDPQIGAQVQEICNLPQLAVAVQKKVFRCRELPRLGCSGHIGILPKIEIRLENRQRRTPFACAELNEMIVGRDQPLLHGCPHIGIRRQIVGGIEQRAGRPALMATVLVEMFPRRCQSLCDRFGDVGVLPQIPVGVEEAYRQCSHGDS